MKYNYKIKKMTKEAVDIALEKKGTVKAKRNMMVIRKVNELRGKRPDYV